MNRMRLLRVMTAATVLAAAAACVDGPSVSGPEAQAEPLAETFDAMAKVAAESGDLARSEGFAFAALSVRGGVAPSRLEVQSGTTTEVYDAFVSSVEWDPSIAVAMRPPARRSLVAWRRTTYGTTKVLSMHTPIDSAPVLNPLSLGMGASTAAVFAGASAMQNEGGNTVQGRPDMSGAWFATSGWVKLKEVAVLGACPASQLAGKGVALSHCEQARYLVRFDLVMQHLTGRPPQVVSGSPVRRVSSIGEPVVNGLRLGFACVVPTSMHGCR